jgi:hypothetical protein
VKSARQSSSACRGRTAEQCLAEHAGDKHGPQHQRAGLHLPGAPVCHRHRAVTMASPAMRRFPVTVTRLPVTRCQICQRTIAHRPGEASAVLTEHYRRMHPHALIPESDSSDLRECLPLHVRTLAPFRVGRSRPPRPWDSAVTVTLTAQVTCATPGPASGFTAGRAITGGAAWTISPLGTGV